MKCLSVQQPWAHLIVQGIKDIENRDWSVSYRGDLLIHAAKQIDLDARVWLMRHFPELEIPDNLPTGGLVGRAHLENIVTQSLSPWFVGKYGWVLSDAHVVPFVAVRGMPGLFDLEESIYG